MGVGKFYLFIYIYIFLGGYMLDITYHFFMMLLGPSFEATAEFMELLRNAVLILD